MSTDVDAPHPAPSSASPSGAPDPGADPVASARLARWERDSTWALGVAAVVFLVCYSARVLAPDLSTGWRRTLIAVDYLTWVMFVGDYVVRLSLARPRLRWFLRNLPELLVVVVPVLRPLRLLRLVVLIRVLNRWAASSLRGRVGLYVLTSSVLVVYSGALAELSAERRAPGSNITTFGTSLWWAMTTVTTVGYGDHYPVTVEGRLVAAVLMVAGIALIGTVTASIASYLVDRVSAERRQTADSTDDPAGAPLGSSTAVELAALREQVAELSALLRERAPAASGGRGAS